MNLDNYIKSCGRGSLVTGYPDSLTDSIYLTAQLIFLKPLEPLKVMSLDAGLDQCRVGPGTYTHTFYGGYIMLGTDRHRARDILTSVRNKHKFICRFQSSWQHFKMAAGEKVGLVGQALWAISICMAARRPTDKYRSWIDSHVMVLLYQQNEMCSKLCDKAVAYWKSKKTIPTEVLMHRLVGPNHPLVEAWKPYN